MIRVKFYLIIFLQKKPSISCSMHRTFRKQLLSVELIRVLTLHYYVNMSSKNLIDVAKLNNQLCVVKLLASKGRFHLEALITFSCEQSNKYISTIVHW